MVLKILLVKPDGQEERIEADYWEFSQKKFINEDVVLVFYKTEPNVEKKGEKEKIIKPSHKGIISQERFKENLEQVLGKDIIESMREEKEIKFSKEIYNPTKLNITTSKKVLENGKEDIIDSLKELLEEEKKLILDNHIINIFQPPRIQLEGNQFFIEEILFIGKQ